MNIIILIPVFNDFRSTSILLEEIDRNISDLNASFSVIVINDASTEEKNLDYKNLNKIRSIKLINMRNNKGHSRCIATGLKHISENEDFDYVIPMDGDGEDRPEEITNLYSEAIKGYDIVMARRKKRKDKFLKRLTSKLFYLVFNFLTDQKLDSRFTSFGIFSNKVIKTINKYNYKNLNLKYECRKLNII